MRVGVKGDSGLPVCTVGDDFFLWGREIGFYVVCVVRRLKSRFWVWDIDDGYAGWIAFAGRLANCLRASFTLL